MREFRVWCKKAKNYIENIAMFPDGSLIVYDNNAGDSDLYCFRDTDDSCYSKEHYKDLFVEFYTGILDKNGKKIFESDIVKGGGWTRDEYVIYWNEFRCGFEGKMENGLIYGISENETEFMEVIGNVHE